MIPYSQFSPTAVDPSGICLPEAQEWLVAPCTVNRDSGVLAKANWRTQLEALRALELIGEDFELHRFGHWACGWFEIIIVRPGSRAAELCESFENALANYPVLSDENYSALMQDTVQAYWRNMSLQERRELCSKVGIKRNRARNINAPYSCNEALESAVIRNGEG